MLNLLGSVFFGDLGHRRLGDPVIGIVTNLRWDNGGTFLGARCFLIAAVMLLPGARTARVPTTSS